MSRKKSFKAEGHARVIRNDCGEVVAEEVVCLGWCGKTFFRQGHEIGKKAVRKCLKCQKISVSPRCRFIETWA